MTFGAILVIIGILFLLKNLGFLVAVNWSLIWPIFLIVIGLSLISKKNEQHNWWNCWHFHKREEDK